jgi:hypothetical protein
MPIRPMCTTMETIDIDITWKQEYDTHAHAHGGIWPKTPKMSKFSSASTRKCRSPQNHRLQGKRQHCYTSGIIALQNGFYRIKVGSRVSDIRLLTQLE